MLTIKRAIAESYYDKYFLGFEMCLYQLDEGDMQLVCEVFEKVWDNLPALRDCKEDILKGLP